MTLGQRDKFAKRLKRLRPDNLEIVMPRVDSVIKILKLRGFSLRKYDDSESSVSSHELWFERPHSDEAFEYVEIGFADNGELQFGLSCGVRSYDDPDIWHLYATLTKRRFGIWRTLDMGDYILSPFKRQTFVRDWRLLTDSLDGIVHFLESGEPTKHLVNVMIFEPFRPRAH